MKKWPKPLCQSVESSLDSFFKQLNGEEPTDLYQMVLTEMERPLLEVVMRESENNQSRAARMLGLNRNTLRKKLRTHGLDG
jgi:Fis family transcriptional regulator